MTVPGSAGTAIRDRATTAGPPGTAVSERARLAELRAMEVLDTPARPEVDVLTALAAHVCDTPMAVISLVDDHREWFQARTGLDVSEVPRDDALGAHVVATGGPVVVPDATTDPRYAGAALVVGPAGVRCYAGVPLTMPSGAVLGTLAVLDRRPRDLSGVQLTHLTGLAAQATAQLLLRREQGRLVAEVTAHRAAEESLRANERLLRGVLSHPEAVIFAKDLKGRYLLCNSTGHQQFGVPDGSLIGRTDDEVLDAASAAVLHRTDAQVLRHGGRLTATETFVQVDGARRDFQTTKFPLRDQDGKVYAVAGISTDVTAQLATERALRQSERRWRHLFDASPVGVGLIDGRDTWIAVNPALCTLLGRSADELLGAPAGDVLPPDHRPGIPFAVGARRWAESTIAHTDGPDGQPWTVVHLQDVTARLAAERSARQVQSDLTAVVEVVRRVRTAADAHHLVVQACIELAGADTVQLLEPVADGTRLEITSASRLGLRGRTVPLSVRDTGGPGLDPRAAAYLSGESVLTQHRLPHTPGVAATAPGVGLLIPMRSSGGISVLAVEWAPPGPEPDDRRIRVVTMLADQAGSALGQRSLLSELETLAHTDELTRLPNRRSWDLRLRALFTSVPSGRGLVIALIDLDHFKAYNDTRGHAAGDELLAGFARRARAQLKSGDMLARWGGEEFALALVDCAPDDVEAVLHRVRRAVPDGQTCSIGYRMVDGTDRPESVMARADAALYLAKNTGRDRVCGDPG